MMPILQQHFDDNQDRMLAAPWLLCGPAYKSIRRLYERYMRYMPAAAAGDQCGLMVDMWLASYPRLTVRPLATAARSVMRIGVADTAPLGQSRSGRHYVGNPRSVPPISWRIPDRCDTKRLLSSTKESSHFLK